MSISARVLVNGVSLPNEQRSKIQSQAKIDPRHLATTVQVCRVDTGLTQQIDGNEPGPIGGKIVKQIS